MSKRRLLILFLFFFTGFVAVYQTAEKVLHESESTNMDKENRKWELVYEPCLSAVIPLFLTILIYTVITIQEP